MRYLKAERVFDELPADVRAAIRDYDRNIDTQSLIRIAKNDARRMLELIATKKAPALRRMHHGRLID